MINKYIDLNVLAIHNIYEIRDLQLKKYEEKYKENECEYLKNIAKINLEKEKNTIMKRLKKIKGDELKYTNENFDHIVEVEFENFHQMDDRAIKSTDFSYNLVHIENFTHVGLTDLKLKK
jgi:hypothetical protein